MPTVTWPFATQDCRGLQAPELAGSGAALSRVGRQACRGQEPFMYLCIRMTTIITQWHPVEPQLASCKAIPCCKAPPGCPDVGDAGLCPAHSSAHCGTLSSACAWTMSYMQLPTCKGWFSSHAFSTALMGFLCPARREQSRTPG